MDEAYYDVAREVHYPSTVGKKLTHRPRCDLVLNERGRPLKLDSAVDLFEPADQAQSAEALWLEVKWRVSVPRARSASSGVRPRSWRTAGGRRPAKDGGRRGIHEAGLVLVVFTESHDILQRISNCSKTS
jgi:hypothetical protein